MSARATRGRAAAVLTLSVLTLLAAPASVFAAPDTTPPSGRFLSIPNDGGIRSMSGGKVNLTWSANDSGSGLASMTVTEYLGRIALSGTCIGVSWKSAWTVSHPSPFVISGFAPGYCYKWVLNLKDRAGNRSSFSSGVAYSTSAPNKSAEMYFLSLINCMRTGGLVTTGGSCIGYGSGRYSRYVRPLLYSEGISNLVTRPYAGLIARWNRCDHTADGTIRTRLARSGFRYTWVGENIGCGGNTPLDTARWTALSFQAEKASNGPHWANLKNPPYTSVGVGIGVSGGEVRAVLDFVKAW